MTPKKEEKKGKPVKKVAKEKKVSHKEHKNEGKSVKEEKKEVKAEKKEAKAEKFDAIKLSPHETLEAYKIVLHPLITEKAINLIEAENKLVFVVKKNTNKVEVKKAVEGLYGIKVDSVNIVNDSKSRKKAFVKISGQFNAGEIATRLGVL